MSDPVENMVMNMMETPKAPVGSFDLPVGLLEPNGQLHTHVMVREIVGHDEDMLAAKSIPGYKKFGLLVHACTLELGPYKNRETIDARLPELLSVDRAFLLVAIRRVTLGNEYPYKHQCPKCEFVGIYTVDLSTLVLKPMSAEDKVKRIFTCALPSKKEVIWHPLTTRTEEKMNALVINSPNDQMSLGMMARIEMIGGQPPTLEAVKGLSMLDRTTLRDAFEAREGGLEDKLEMTCVRCSHEFEATLDIGQTGFFFPSRVKKASK